MSEKFEATKNLLNGTSKNPSPDSEVSDVSKKSSYHKTPKKKLKASAATTVDDISICQLRTIVFESKYFNIFSLDKLQQKLLQLVGLFKMCW